MDHEAPLPQLYCNILDTPQYVIFSHEQKYANTRFLNKTALSSLDFSWVLAKITTCQAAGANK